MSSSLLDILSYNYIDDIHNDCNMFYKRALHWLDTVIHKLRMAGDGKRVREHPYRMLLIGETGSGKTSFLNLLCNSKLIEELGTNFDAEKINRIRHYNDLKIEDSTARAMASKTSEAKLYNTEVCEMRMTVIDTPGFGDSRGLEQDKVNVKKIIDVLRHEDHINCVCLVIHGRYAYMSVNLKYVLSEISAMLPKEVIDNIIVVFTNTADPLECSFDMCELDNYFEKEIEQVFYIENPYCRIEKAKHNAKQLSIDQITKSLKKSFEDTAKCLSSLQETIKDFKGVQTLHFIRLYDTKQEIEGDFDKILASYDQQTDLDKKIKKAGEEVDAALKSKSHYADFKTTKEVKVAKPVPIPDKGHNTLCKFQGCYSNCHISCRCFDKPAYNQEEFKKCICMASTNTCQKCGHSYQQHYHDQAKFQKFKESQEFIDEATKKKFEEATDMEQRADYLRQGLQTQREELLRQRDSHLQELNGKIDKFQSLGISRQDYAKCLEKQLGVVKLCIEDTIGAQDPQINALKQNLENRLGVDTSAFKHLPVSQQQATDDHCVTKEQKQLQEKEMELQEKEREVQGKNRELQEKEGELQEKERELHQSQDAVRIYQQQASTDDHWVINKDEVILTEEELGRGSYATVNVGTFRGLRVAVKSLHTIIISDDNLALFSREMSIASQLRHPNLVQFIGATKVGNPLILTELMSTSLHKELQKNQLTRQQILSIAQDVASGLNYLHLFNPQPIIHRDVSSPNVLLKPSTGPAGYEAKVADYGTAKLQQGNSTGTEMPGNPAYAAPEAPIPDQHSPAMDVYSYSVLLMEITLRSPPEMTTDERERQSHNVSWSPMKSLIQRGLNTTRQDRPTMSQVIESLREIKV